MRSIQNYIISCNNRYNNSKKIEGKELILNTEITERDYQFVNRIGIIKSTPLYIKTPAQIGDYIVSPEEVFAYKRNNEWHCFDQFCFVKPIKQKSKWEGLKEKDLQGVLVYSNNYLKELGLSEGDVVGFKPESEYEFNIDGQKLYRILSNYITTNYVEETKSN